MPEGGDASSGSGPAESGADFSCAHTVEGLDYGSESKLDQASDEYPSEFARASDPSTELSESESQGADDGQDLIQRVSQVSTTPTSSINLPRRRARSLSPRTKL